MKYIISFFLLCSLPFYAYSQSEIEMIEHERDSLLQVLNTIPPNDTAQFAILEELAYIEYHSLMNQEKYLTYMERYLDLAKQKNAKEHLDEIYRLIHNYSSVDTLLYHQRTEDATEYFMTNKDTLGIIDILISKSLYAREKCSNNEESLQYLKEAWELSQITPDELQSTEIQLLFGITLTCMEDYEGAISYFDKILIKSDEDFDHQKSYAAYQKAICYENLNQLDSVPFFYQQSIEISKKQDNFYVLQHMYGGLGDFHLKQGDMKQAKKYYAKVEPLAKLNDCDCTPLAENYQQIALHYITSENIDSAIVFLKKSIEQAHFERQYNQQVLINNREADLHLSKIYETQGKLAAALKYLKQYHLYKDSLVNTTAIVAAEEFDAAYGSSEKTEKINILNSDNKSLSTANASLSAQNKAYLIAMLAVGVAALVSLFSFFNIRRKNELISAQKSDLEAQKKHLEQLNFTKDRIFAIIGHDMRKPALAFRGIGKKVNYLVRKQDYTTLHALGNEIEKDALALNKLTNNLLNWALTQKNVMPYQPQRILMAEAVTETLALFGSLTREKGIQIRYEVAENLYTFADRNALLTIIRNLVDNAIKYTPNNGQINIIAALDNDTVTLQVEDTGIGIQPEQLHDIFLLKENKSTAGTSGEKGTGLGLHLVHELVQLNKGTIKVFSELGQGTRFDLELPRV